MSAKERRKAGQAVYRKPELRLVPSPGKPARPEPDPELKEILDGLRRQDARRVRINPGPEDKDAA